MKVLWITNILPGFLSKRLGVKTNNNLGWLDYSAELLINSPNVELNVFCPHNEIKDGDVGIKYFTFPEKYMRIRDDRGLIECVSSRLQSIMPDIIHIYGTEFFHTIGFIKALEELHLIERCVISIQGLVSVYADHFYALLPTYSRYMFTVRDFLRFNNIALVRHNFISRGIAEKESLRKVKNIIGRTEWDFAISYQINPERRYFKCNETLRESFYQGEWSFCNCKKHSIFVSQSSYSIKGFHLLIEALINIRAFFPDVKVYVTGDDVFSTKWYRIDSYHHYLKKLIQKNKLGSYISFLGNLNADEMKKQYLQANVFVMCSSIENSPNSLGEAMLLGTPCVAADVGGITQLITHEKEGFVYPFDEIYMLSHYICRVFSEGEEISKMSSSARERARKTHNPVTNNYDLIKIYQSICL